MELQNLEQIGIRDLKANLSRHLRKVTAGARLTVTEHGRAIATIVPIESAQDTEWAHQLVAGGHARWTGGKPGGKHRGASAKAPVISGKNTVAAAVIEDRR